RRGRRAGRAGEVPLREPTSGQAVRAGGARTGAALEGSRAGAEGARGRVAVAREAVADRARVRDGAAGGWRRGGGVRAAAAVTEPDGDRRNRTANLPVRSVPGAS